MNDIVAAKHLYRTLLACLCIPLLSGCAAMEVGLEHKDLSVQTKMSATVFLDVANRHDRTVYLEVKNTSDKEIHIASLLKQKLEAKGYTVTTDPDSAFYILQVNVLYVGKASPSALHSSLYAGWGGEMGGLMGQTIGANSGGLNGTIEGHNAGGMAGGAAELIAGALVKNVTYAMITDVQIMERSGQKVAQTVESSLAQGTGTKVIQTSQSVQNRRTYQTRVASSANRVNLTFDKARPGLEQGLATAIAGIF